MVRSAKGSSPSKAVIPWMVAVVVGAMGVRSPADEPDSKAREAARSRGGLKAAEHYLVLLDKGKYAESWEAAAVSLRKALPQRKWVDALSRSRDPFGKLQDRKLNRVEMASSTGTLGRMDQAWVYSDLRFTSGESCGELAIVYFENGTTWKVSGYFIGDPETFPKPKPKPEDKAAGPAKD